MKKLVYCSVLLVGALAMQAQIPVPGRILVGFKSHVGTAEAQNVMRGMGARAWRRLGNSSAHVMELPANANVHTFTNSLKNRFEVQYAEQDMYVPPVQVTPNDPSYSSQWHLPRIAAPAAWSTTTGSTAIKIAILDTGVDPTHSDLVARFVPGWNTYDNNSNSADVYGHGTKVAGTASATGNNGLGVAGVSWNTLIMPIRVTDTAGYATYSTIASALNWAADNGARVANISFDITGSATVASAAQYFQSKGGVVATSAGNSGTVSTLAPSPYLMTVSATDPNDAIYSWSTTGNRVTLSAPGCVTTTFNGNTYGSACGTSFSSPVVAGVAALVLSANPNLTPTQVISILQSTADDLGTAGLDTTFGYGRVNAAKAVALALTTSGGSSSTTSGGGTSTPPINPTPPTTPDTIAPSITLTSPGAGSTISGNVTVTFNATDNKGVSSVEFLVNGSVVSMSTTAPFTIKWNTIKLQRGTYLLQGRAKDAAGNTGLSNLVTVYR